MKEEFCVRGLKAGVNENSASADLKMRKPRAAHQSLPNFTPVRRSGHRAARHLRRKTTCLGGLSAIFGPTPAA